VKTSNQFSIRTLSDELASTAATILLTWLNEKHKERWTEVVGNINFTHFSGWHRKIPLTGKSRNPDRPCSQLVMNGSYKARVRESDRLVSKEVAEL